MNPNKFQPKSDVAAERATARANDTSFKAGLRSLQSGFDWLLGRAQSLAEGVLPKKGDTAENAWKEALKAEAQPGRVSPIPVEGSIPEYPTISDADVEKLTPEEAVQLAQQLNRLEAQRAKAEKKARHRRRDSAPDRVTEEPPVPAEAYKAATALETEISEWFEVRQPPHAGWKDRFLECSGSLVTVRTVAEGHRELQLDLASDVAAVQFEEQTKRHTPTVVFVGPSGTRLLEVRLAEVTNPQDMTVWMEKFHTKKAAASPSQARRDTLP